MRAWFESLQPRERNFVLAAAVSIVLAFVYFALWRPIDRHHSNLQTNVETWKAAVRDIRPLQAQMQNASARTAVGRNDSLVVIIDSTLRQRGLYNSLQRSQPTAQNGIRVEFENASFDDLILWLGDLGQTYGMHLQSGSFSSYANASPGRVNATVTLER